MEKRRLLQWKTASLTVLEGSVEGLMRVADNYFSPTAETGTKSALQ
jgi:hypothetical protein